jgi:uncharacterized protein YjiS (DUF1127 family)
MGAGMNGPAGMDACGPMAQGRYGMACMNPPPGLPEELKARMESVRTECREIRELWAKAVAARGEKSIEDLRKDFARDNAAAIAKMKADAKALKEDLRACREGFGPKNAPDMHMEMPGMTDMPGMPDMPMHFGNGQLRSEIENDVVTRINALKEPLTVDAYSRIVREVMAEHRGDFAEAFRNGPAYGMGPMAPDLAHMREAMCKMRDASWMEKRQFRNELRKAMKIEDVHQREEAVRKVLEKYSQEPEEPATPPAPEAPAKPTK